MPKTHAIAEEHAQRQKPGEPEEHGQGLDAEDDEFVVRPRFGEAPGDEDEEEEGGDEGPDGGEDEEVELRWGNGVPEVGPPVGD